MQFSTALGYMRSVGSSKNRNGIEMRGLWEALIIDGQLRYYMIGIYEELKVFEQGGGVEQD